MLWHHFLYSVSVYLRYIKGKVYIGHTKSKISIFHPDECGFFLNTVYTQVSFHASSLCAQVLPELVAIVICKRQGCLAKPQLNYNSSRNITALGLCLGGSLPLLSLSPQHLATPSHHAHGATLTQSHLSICPTSAGKPLQPDFTQISFKSFSWKVPLHLPKTHPQAYWRYWCMIAGWLHCTNTGYKHTW